MRTITFYSYKGGVGRSLLVANVATYLATLGKRVFAIDFDLEAPGLHYKFNSPRSADEGLGEKYQKGLVDVLEYFVGNKILPERISAYAETIPSQTRNAATIDVMRAGLAPEAAYWEQLSRLDWHSLFYGPSAEGAQFFLELKERIRLEFQPDFLLIDARTGMTEMGAVATTLLPDIVVCLALASFEHLEGLRTVLRSINATPRHDPALPRIELVPVLSRLPIRRDVTLEEAELERVKTYLSAPDSLGVPLVFADIAPLHSEPGLDAGERLLVGGSNSPNDFPLLRDYLRLFSRIIPAEDIRPHVGELIQRATARMLDDPDGAQGDLEALSAYSADETAMRALLKLYRLRKAPLDKIVSTAYLMWHLRVSASDPLLVDVARTAFSEPRSAEALKKYIDFADAVWRSDGAKDARMALTLVGAYMPDRRDQAVRLLREHVARVDPPNPLLLAKLLDLLRSDGQVQEALAMAQRLKGVLVNSPEFLGAWTRLVLDQKDRSLAAQLLSDSSYRSDLARTDDPWSVFRILKLTNAPNADAFLMELAEQMITEGGSARLRELAEVFQEEGRLPELMSRLRDRVPSHVAEEIVEFAQRRMRRGYSSRLAG